MHLVTHAWRLCQFVHYGVFTMQTTLWTVVSFYWNESLPSGTLTCSQFFKLNEAFVFRRRPHYEAHLLLSIMKESHEAVAEATVRHLSVSWQHFFWLQLIWKFNERKAEPPSWRSGSQQRLMSYWCQPGCWKWTTPLNLELGTPAQTPPRFETTKTVFSSSNPLD